MPLYEYECESCGVRFEVIQKYSDPSVSTCKACGGQVRRLLSAPAIQFKGTGWYITDYARKGSGGEKPASSPEGGTSAGGSGGGADAGASKPAASGDSSGSSAAGSSSATSTSSSEKSEKSEKKK